MGRKNRRKKSEKAKRIVVKPNKYISKQDLGEERMTVVGNTIHAVEVPRRGEIWFADLGRHPGTSVQEGCRPVFIMSNDMANGHSATVTVVPMTSKKKKAYLPTHVLMGVEDCPSLEPSMALAEQITTIDKSALSKRIGRVSSDKTKEIEKAVLVQLFLADLTQAEMSRPGLGTGTMQKKEMVSYGS